MGDTTNNNLIRRWSKYFSLCKLIPVHWWHTVQFPEGYIHCMKTKVSFYKFSLNYPFSTKHLTRWARTILMNSFSVQSSHSFQIEQSYLPIKEQWISHQDTRPHTHTYTHLHTHTHIYIYIFPRLYLFRISKTNHMHIHAYAHMWFIISTITSMTFRLCTLHLFKYRWN